MLAGSGRKVRRWKARLRAKALRMNSKFNNIPMGRMALGIGVVCAAWGGLRAAGTEDGSRGVAAYERGQVEAVVSDTLYFEVDADNHAFMCPFLSPMFRERLMDAGAHWTRKDELHRVYAAFPVGTMTEEGIVDCAEKTGYMREIITVRACSAQEVP
jgi:hypothetical protein